MRSMTGAGRGSAMAEGITVTADIRTVNHRFLDLAFRLPRHLAFLDDTVRKVCAEGLRRGHAEIYLDVSGGTGSSTVESDEPLTAAYAGLAEKLAATCGVANDLTVSRLMSLEGVIRTAEAPQDEDLLTNLAAQALREAVSRTVIMREREGEALKADLNAHLAEVARLRAAIAERAPMVVDEYRVRLNCRLQELLQGAAVDEARLAQEVAIMADRCAIDEELARLESHVAQMQSYLEAEGELGKKMDFLIQEMNREANTIGSKANDATIAQLVVTLKSEIEKLREQVQNVE